MFESKDISLGGDMGSGYYDESIREYKIRPTQKTFRFRRLSQSPHFYKNQSEFAENPLTISTLNCMDVQLTDNNLR